VDQFGDYLYRYAISRVRDSTIAEDLVQEVFLAAFQSRKNFQHRSSEKTWLTGILKHKIADSFRKKAKEQWVDNIESNINKLEKFFDQKGQWKIKPVNWNADPYKLYEQNEFMKVLFDCLAGLSERQAKAFILREVVGESTKEICKILDISATNSWVILYRARMHLRSCIEVNWFTETTVEGG